MEVRYDRTTCTGWFQCVQEWDAFQMDVVNGKADLEESKENEDNIFVRVVPDGFEEEAVAAAEACPVNAIEVYDEGEKIAPEE